jgi:hypothetical protein
MKTVRFTDWWIGLKKVLYKKVNGEEIIHGEK